GEELANEVEHPGVRRRIRAGRITDRVLIDTDDLVDVFQSDDIIVGGGDRAGAMQLAGQRVVQDLLDQRAFAAAADAGNGDEAAEREGNVDVFQVVLPRSLDDQRFLRSPTRERGIRQSLAHASGSAGDAPI